MAEEYRFGEIVLVDYPFSDGIRSKLRPALVLTTHADGDILVARITSTPRMSPFEIALIDWPDGKLLMPSVVRVSKLATLLPRLIVRRIGSISSSDRKQVLAGLHAFIDSLG